MTRKPAPQPPFLIRELRWEDFPGRLRAYLDLYDEVREDPDIGMTLMASPPAEAEEAGWFADLYRRSLENREVILVGEIAGQPAGMVSITSVRFAGRPSENSHVGVLGVLVARGFRGRGLGEAMLVRALELARTKFEIVRLNVFSVNVRAKRLYERLGFRTVGVLAREVKRGSRYLDEEIMSLDLAGWTPPPGRSDAGGASR